MTEILTEAFKNSLKPMGLMYPKVIKHKAVRNYMDYGFNSTIKKAKKPHYSPKKALKKVKRHLPSIRKLKAKADVVFSVFIRNRDGNKCVLCSSTKIVQNGHLIKRGKMSTRYDEDNCHALCSGCNYKDNFEPQHYMTWLVEKYGYPVFKRLVDKSKEIKQMKRLDYELLIKKYENSPTKD